MTAADVDRAEPADATPPMLPPDDGRPRRRSLRRNLVIGAVVAVVLVVFGVWTMAKVNAASRAGYLGAEFLESAESSIRDGDVERASERLDVAEEQFRRAKAEVRSLGPLRVATKVVPLVRVQVRAAESFAQVGIDLTAAARDLTVAADEILRPESDTATVADAIARLGAAREVLDSGVTALESAHDRVSDLDGLRLVGVLGTARTELSAALTPALDRARSARDGLDAAMVFLGADAPRNWLVISQNPDEARPLGGFIGTIGLLAVDGDQPEIVQHEGIQQWQGKHPGVFRAWHDAPNAFAVPADEKVAQYMANVNATFDWQASAELAMEFWERAGEPPVAGVLSLSPESLVRILGVVGPVPVPGYVDEVLTPANLIERLDYHTHERGGGTDDAAGKDFVADSAKAILDAMAAAPASAYLELGRAFGASFDAREALGWSTDETVAAALADHGWDGRLDRAIGDFVAYGEFSYQAKNGRTLVREFDHRVVVADDGSGQVTTTVTIRNTGEPSIYNIDSQSYITVLGPVGAEVSDQGDDWFAAEGVVDGHPGVGYVRSALPGGETGFTVVWDVPQILAERADGVTGYRLQWLRVIGAPNDTVRLTVELPESLTWADAAPSSSFSLDSDFDQFWPVEPRE